MKTSPLAIAAAVICGILFVIGILLLVVGGIAFSRRDAAIGDMRAQINDRDISGEGVSPTEQSGDMDIARTQAAAAKQQAVDLLVAGGLFLLPMGVFGAVSAGRRKR